MEFSDSQQERGDRQPTRTPGELQTDEDATIRCYKDNISSVVYIINLAVKQHPFTLVPRCFGAGFIWDSQGHIVTNYHVIQGAFVLRVTLANKSTYRAKVLGSDPDKDVAVLLVEGPVGHLRPVAIGSSAGLRIGQKVLAIGHPFELLFSLTEGVISGPGRKIGSAATGRPIQGVIQSTAAINPGNSGGPLLDIKGYLIGINTSMYSLCSGFSGVGFSIPVDTVVGIVNRIVKVGIVTRPNSGIKSAPDQSVEQLGVSGVHVLDAPPDGPAGKVDFAASKEEIYTVEDKTKLRQSKGHSGVAQYHDADRAQKNRERKKNSASLKINENVDAMWPGKKTAVYNTALLDPRDKGKTVLGMSSPLVPKANFSHDAIPKHSTVHDLSVQGKTGECS